MVTRGIRNCNPLNIRIGNDWKGEVAENTDKVFEQFTEMKWGLRAALIILRRYITKYKVNTIRQIVSRWAPETENATRIYINFVSSHSGIVADKPIQWSDVNSIVKIVRAMCVFESNFLPQPALVQEAMVEA